MDASLEVPPHLRQYVVTQDYDAYTEEDQAVWRFVVLQTYARLIRTGHAAYAQGFADAGITVDRIPHIDHMSERLRAHGFGAVCVDGFIPPRAFQAFQANGILPIAADIRTSKQLAYTPAPDIIHEAAGHAPFLSHPAYAHYLRRIGSVSEQAFSDAYDRELYAAVYQLSELKADPASSASQIAAAEGVLDELARRSVKASESAQLARLYWWTVEYGLVGTLTDYRLYGAGLLSSLGEGHFCHEPGVQKLPLTAACIEQSYDITRLQPRLYVTRDFEQLERVLEDVEQGLSYARGGLTALAAARASGEAATLELLAGTQLAGTVTGHELDARGELAWVELAGPCALARAGQVHPSWPRPLRYVLPLGATSDGQPLGGLSVAELARRTRAGRLELTLQSGLRVCGRSLELWQERGRVLGALLAECEIHGRGQLLLAPGEPYPLLLASELITAAADLPRGFHAQSEFASKRVPKARQFSAEQRGLIRLFERTRAAVAAGDPTLRCAELARTYAEVAARYPHDWLLRWNLLAALLKDGARGELTARLESELLALERRFGGREPIATGLMYLRALGS